MKWIVKVILFNLLLCLALPLRAEVDAQLRQVDKAIRVRDYAAAVKLLKPLVQADKAEAHFRMGALYRSGRALKQDIDKALQHYQNAALQGHVDAQYAFGALLEKRKRLEEARKWYRIAADQGHRKAAFMLVELEKQIRARPACRSQEMIFNSVRRNDVAQIQACIEGGFDFQILDENLHTPLVAAILADKQEVIDLLLPVSKDINQVDAQNNQALHYAAAKGDRNLVLRLIERGASIDQPDGLGNTALTIAVRRDDGGLVDLLLMRKANPAIPNQKKKTAIDLARARADQGVARAFSRHGIKLQQSAQRTLAVDIKSFEQSVRRSGDALYKGWPILSIASLLGEKDIVSQLLAKKVDVNARDKTGNSALHRAASKGQTQVLGMLLGAGAKLNARNKNGETALYLAARAGHVDAVERLLEKGADSAQLTTNKQSALEVAVANRHAEVAMLLARRPLNPGSRHAALLVAVQNELSAAAIVLVGVDKQLEKPDKNKRTVLWHSAERGLQKVVAKLILRNKLGLDTRDVNGYSPLARAVSNGHQTIAQMLIGVGADLGTRTEENNSLLMLAVASGYSAMVDKILASKPQLDAKNSTGETALMLAAESGQQTIVAKLIEAGADIQLRNRDDMNAYEIASNAGHQAVAVYIREKSGKLFKLFN